MRHRLAGHADSNILPPLPLITHGGAARATGHINHRQFGAGLFVTGDQHIGITSLLGVNQQGPGNQDRVSSATAKWRQVQASQGRVIFHIGIAIAVGNPPGDFTTIHINGCNRRIGRFQQRQALGPADTTQRDAYKIEIGIAFIQGDDDWYCHAIGRGYVEHACFEIMAGPGPVCTPAGAGAQNSAPVAATVGSSGSSEQRAPGVVAEYFFRLGAQLRGEVNQIIDPHTLFLKGRRLAGNRLGR